MYYQIDNLMKKTIFNTLFISLLTAFLLFRCTDDKVIPEEVVPPPVVHVNGIPSSGFTFLYFEETQKSFTVESDAPWEISKTEGWFTISPYKGVAGTTQVTLYVADNDDVARSGKFTVTANSGTRLKPCNVSQEFGVSQGGYLSAEIMVSGLTGDSVLFEAENPGTQSFGLFTASPWNITLSNSSWVSVSPASGNGGTSVTVTIAPAANAASAPRECTLTVTSADPLNPSNADTKEITIRQHPYYEWDTNLAVGAELFGDDFDWLIPLWGAIYPKYGWPTVQVGTTGIYNEYTFATEPLNTQMANRGWSFASAYARAEGWVKLGAASALGHITTRSMTEIAPEKVANLLVSFDGALYASASGTRDNNSFTVSVLGGGTINDTQEQSMIIPIQTHFGFDKYYFIVNGATASTQIRLGKVLAQGETASNTRFILDNVKIIRTSNFDPILPETHPVELPLKHEVQNCSDAASYRGEEVVKEGATLKYSIWVNRAWTATPSANWLRFTQVFYALAANGGTVPGGVGTATATALTYDNCLIAVDPNPTNVPRTATITLASGGQTLETITITQEAGTPPADNIALTGIIGDKVTLVAQSPSMVLFKVYATSDWSLSSTGEWFTLLPVIGEANKEVEVVIVPTTNNGAARSGSFTITAGAATKTVTIEQEGTVSTAEILASWMLPYNGTAGSAYFTSYIANDGTADLNVGQWWVKSDDGNSIIRGSRAVENEGTQAWMSYSTYIQPGNTNQDRIIMYGFTLNDYWQMEIPTTGIAAGSVLKIEGFKQSSAGGPRDFLYQYSTDKSTWTNINPKVNGEITYTVQMPSAVTIPISETFTVGAAIPAGMLYIRLLVNSTIRSDGASPQTLGGTSWITRPIYNDDADKLPIMKVSKL